MIDELEALRRAALEELARAQTEGDVATIRTKYLGRKGELTTILRRLGTLSAEERQRIGKEANELKESLNAQIEEVLQSYAGKNNRSV